MKKLLIGLLALGSISSFAETREMTIENLTYPENRIITKCLTVECEKIGVTIYSRHKPIYDKAFYREQIELMARNRRKYRAYGPVGAKPFELTKMFTRKSKTRYKEAYYGKAVANAAVVPVAAALDTAFEVVLSPVRLTHLMIRDKRQDSIKNKRGALRFLSNFDSGLETVILKEKYYKEILDSIESLIMDEETLSGVETILKTFENHYGSCFVKKNLAYMTFDLYINERFEEIFSYTNEDDMIELKDYLWKLKNSRICKR